MVCRLDLRVSLAETRLTVCCWLLVVRSTLLQGASFRNQGILTQVGEIPLFTKSSIDKSYPNESFSIPTNMIFNVDSNGVHPRSWIRTYGVEHSHDFDKILRFLWELTSWNQVIWSLVVPNTIPSLFWYHMKSPCVLVHVQDFFFDDFYSISGVLK